jgi:hypothetical protein
LFNNGKEVVRIESGISLKLPENTLQILAEHIDEILKDKF